MDVNAAAGLSTAMNQNQVASAIGVKVLKMAQDQQQSVLSLLDGAIEVADQIAAENAAPGASSIDLQA